MMEQGTQEWHQARLGMVTASRISDVMAKGRSGSPSATRANYMAELVAQRLTGEVPEGFTNAAMQWGTETEPKARMAYEFAYDVNVQQVGFIVHRDESLSAGASPDGLVGDDGLVEFKCPNTATHIATLRGASIDRKYLLQMQWQMACTERQWCDFVSYDPRLPLHLEMHVSRVARDNDMIAEIVSEVRTFRAEMEAMLADLNAIKKEAAQ